MEPEGSLPYSQVPTTCPYPEPNPSSLHPFPLPEDPSKYYLPICVWASPMASFPRVSPLGPCANLSPPPYAPHVQPTSFFSILPPAQIYIYIYISATYTTYYAYRRFYCKLLNMKQIHYNKLSPPPSSEICKGTSNPFSNLHFLLFKKSG